MKFAEYQESREIVIGFFTGVCFGHLIQSRISEIGSKVQNIKLNFADIDL